MSVASVSSASRPGRKTGPAPVRDEHGLDARDRDILIFVGKGLHDKEIGRLLDRSEHTINDRLKRIFRLHGFSTRAEAAVWACKQGWL